MAAPIIKIKRSAVPGKIPTTTSLPVGEFGINTYDGKVYIQQDQGGVGVGSTVIVVNPWSVGLGSNTYNTFFTNGNVGIGTTLPTSKLTVVGDASFSGVVTATDSGLYTNFNVTNSETGAYQFASTGIGFTQNTNNPTLYLIRGKKYQFSVSASGHPFWIKTAQNTGTGDQYNDGVTNNGVQSGIITFSVPFNAPSLLYYICQYHSGMNGKIYIIDAGIGPDISINTTGIITASSFVGNITGNLTGTASFATVAGIATYTSEWILGAAGSSDYTFTGPGFTGAVSDPTLYLIRGQQYKFTNLMGAHPFRIQSTPNGSTGTQYNDGIINNDVSNGTLTWDVQFDAPGLLYYQCTAHGSMGGKIYIIDAGIGPDISINTTGIITASSFVGNITGNLTGTASFATSAGIATFATSSGIATFATSAGIATNVSGGIASVTSLIVSGVSTLGIVTAGNIYSTGIITATAFVGDGSGLTNLTASGSGIVIKDSGSTVGTAGTIDFGDNLTVSAISAGVVTVTATGGGGGGESYWTETNVGIHTLSNVGIGTTNPTEALTVVGVVSATSFVGDGSGLTGITATASVIIGDTPPASPEEGDLWFNTDCARIFIYYDENAVGYGTDEYWIDAAPFNSGVGGAGGGGASVTVSSLPPASPNNGDLWYSTIKARLFIWYTDEDSSQWVDAAPFNSASASILDFPTGDYGDLTSTGVDAFGQAIDAIFYDCLTYPPTGLVSYDLGSV